ncbi:MAG: phosphoheptose isomerase [Nitrospirae bacterium CG_4_10_14_0_8_um_filter_41_23]|nr:D-sedoheptulose 7-phosphate isomerase [Nitrospirota bacterium]OIP59300.1 MAG: phosphoheptose isomerase [Nitrospirae bacterium CG2_30_41_42]PIQ94351.1 MAG: phosphoheptose isomerase [Nitrospirae bacterium CG11_big_fil_rev_8_21_14_0_20_41_14]PIV44193.1 MAG: phosphoheptose isomerase [Nitrospirae bacterium CG02_land_8_20_14_3_00_41_53]PIW87331.1 MAG: phosphoheptose isomerase [Nitrospirae bacterium CG_4_8_14_3_um_filter_41_47]PIY86861.1 MAG: phosphoheptose isomerase [Nitrospirae bacterium CG_4_10
MKDKILKAFEESINVKEKFAEEKNIDKIIEVAKAIANAFNDGKKLILFGNGGSSTDASHIAAEFINRFKKDRPGLPAIALNTDMAVITSIANDYDFSEIFAKQLKALADEGDIVIAISTSGNSPNILKAIDVAKKKRLTTVAFTGLKGEKLASKSTYTFIVPSDNTPRIQETHITLGHVICQMVEEILFEVPRKK